jgi:tRNA1Val (adenine37-N6)-methyltransferase
MNALLKAYVRDGERVDDLQRNGLKIIQNPQWFCFGIDAVLLSDFTPAKKNAVIADLGTGTGIIPLLLSLKNPSTTLHAFEIQLDVADMAQRSVRLNGLESQIHVHPVNMSAAPDLIGKGSCDVVVSNPPYMEITEGMHNTTPHKAISRHELMVSLEGLFDVAHDLLKPGGSFYMIHRPSRMVDIFTTARACRMEPKELQMIHPSASKKPNLMLLRMSKHGRRELKLLDPLYVYNETGGYTDQLMAIYKGAHIDVFENTGGK